MDREPRTKGWGAALWLVAGVALVVLLLALVWQFRRDTSPAQELEFKANRVDLVGQMQVALASAAEAEKSAVLAITDEESLSFADQARASTREVERALGELEKLLAGGGLTSERDLLNQFSEAFVKLRKIDEEVLGLAVRNTNLKAFALAFGPAAEAGAEFDAALARVSARASAGQGSERVVVLAFEARLALLRIRTLLPPHIAEENNDKMDRLEVLMTGEEAHLREQLGRLAATSQLKVDPDLAAAVTSFARFGELKARILALSRENTNVRSLALSLNEKRRAQQVCLEALGALRQAILDEPIAGVTSGRPVRPR
jgi:hypothetical protein